MRPKFLIYSVIFIMLGLAAIYFLRPKAHKLESHSLRDPVQTSASFVSTNKITSNSLHRTTSPTANSSTTKKINDRQKTNEIRQYFESQNQPINFYGRVVDQDNQPLADATVKVKIMHVEVFVPAPGGADYRPIPMEITTDSSGRFEIHQGTGHGVDLEYVEKEGYQVEPDLCPHSFGSSVGSFENPIVFRMWDTNIHERLITGSQKFQIEPDGRAYFIDLTKGAISESNGGDLKIWIQYTNQVVRGQLYDWAAGIEVINGGLQETNAYSMFSAPAEGYVPAFTLQQQIKGGQHGSIGERRFYLKLKNGREYGRMVINLYAPFNTGIPGLIRIEYAINPSGSRILR